MKRCLRPAEQGLQTEGQLWGQSGDSEPQSKMG